MIVRIAFTTSRRHFNLPIKVFDTRSRLLVAPGRIAAASASSLPQTPLLQVLFRHCGILIPYLQKSLSHNLRYKEPQFNPVPLEEMKRNWCELPLQQFMEKFVTVRGLDRNAWDIPAHALDELSKLPAAGADTSMHLPLVRPSVYLSKLAPPSNLH